MFGQNRVMKKAFEDMKEALKEAVMNDVGQTLIKEGKKQHEIFLGKLNEFKAALKKEIKEELKNESN